MVMNKEMPSIHLAHLLDAVANFSDYDKREWKRRAKAWEKRNAKAVPVYSERTMLAALFGAVELVIARYEYERTKQPQLAPMEERAQEVGRMLARIMPVGVGYLLMMFTFGEGGWATYVSNAEREGALKAMQELFSKLNVDNAPRVQDGLEMAQCARINLENMVSMMPALQMHPMLPLLRLQLEQAVLHLEGEPIEEEPPLPEAST